MYYFTSDTHFDHVNILKFDDLPDKSIKDMNERIVKEINQHVKEKDVLFFLGDFCLSKSNNNKYYIESVKFHLNQIICKKIIFIAGNHDRTHLKINGEWIPNWEFWDLFNWQYDENNRLIPNMHIGGYELRLTTKNCIEHNIPVKFDNIRICCNHYSYRVWNKSYHKKNGSINLFGHSHGKLPGLHNSFDVGFSIWKRPLSLLEILIDLMPKHNDKIKI